MSKIIKLQNGKEVDFDILYPKERRFNVENYPYWGNDDKDYYKPLTLEQLSEISLEEVQKIKENIIKSKTNYFRMPDYEGEMTMDEIDEEIKEYRKGQKF